MVRLLRKLLDPLFSFSFRTPNRASGATVYAVINSAYFLLTWKPVRRLVQASFSALLADRTFWTTVLITARCSSSMVAPSSASSRLSGASGWTEPAGSDGLLLLEGVCPP